MAKPKNKIKIIVKKATHSHTKVIVFGKNQIPLSGERKILKFFLNLKSFEDLCLSGWVWAYFRRENSKNKNMCPDVIIFPLWQNYFCLGKDLGNQIFTHRNVLLKMNSA